MSTDNDGKRQRPRRLFSFDSVKSVSSSRRSSAASNNEGLKIARPSNPFDLSNVQEGEDESEADLAQYSREYTEPAVTENASTASPVVDPFADRANPSRLEPVRPISLKATRHLASDSQTSLPTPTRARWEQLRQHVLPATRPSTRPSTPPPRPGSALSSVAAGTPARSGTPKPSRLARLGFKHVVEQARDMVDERRKLGEEILRGCALARYSEVQRYSKDNQGPGSQGNSTGGGATSRMDYLRRPQSVMSLSSSSTGTQGPSLRSLYQILLYHAGSDEQNSSPLPHESQVLSTLLCPFLTPSKYPQARLEEERITAMESYELLSKSWVPDDESASVERCLWCCKAAGSLPPCVSRTRILGSLWRNLVPGDSNRILLSTHGFQSISNGLVLLLATLYRTSPSPPPGLENGNLVSPSFRPSGSTFTEFSLQQSPHPDVTLLQDLVQQFLSGSLGEIEDDGVEEVYGVEFGNADRRHMASIRRAIFLDSMMNAIENSPGNGEWLLCNLLEQYWLLPDASLPDVWTTLQAAISSRKLNTFCRFSLQMLQPFISRSLAKPPQMSRSTSTFSSTSTDTVDYQALQTKVPSQILALLQTRVIPEAEALDNGTELDVKIVSEVRVNVARTILEILCLDCDLGPGTGSPKSDVFGGPNSTTSENRSGGMNDMIKWAADILSQWYRAGNGSPWKNVLEATFVQVIAAEWKVSISMLSSLLKCIPVDLRKTIFSSIIPMLNDQLVQTSPPYPFPELVAFLSSVSKSLPPVFFRPLFACAASDKDIVVANHLCAMHIHSKYVIDYWLRDVDMLCMALLADAPNQNADSSGQRTPARLGQLIAFVELIGKMQLIRHQKENLNSLTDGQFGEIVRFVTILEHRLWMMVEAKERKAPLDPSICMLICILFREIRLLTKSLKPPLWIARTLKWFEDFLNADYIGDMDQEVTSTVQRIQALYAAAEAGTQERHDRPTSILAAAGSKATSVGQSDLGKPLNLGATFAEHKKFIASLSKGYVSKALKLFVTMSALIDEDEYNILGPLLWEHCLLDNVDASSTASSCFLLMQCAEKTPVDLKADIEIDLKSSNDTTRLEAVRKMSILINWRFQIITQNFLADRAHRPFKLARPPLPFIAADMGTSLYVYTEDSDESKENDGVPLELRQRLAELGWVENNDKVIDPRQEWIKTPMSILPANQFDRMEVGTTDLAGGGSNSPLSSPQPSPRKLGVQRDNAQSLQPVDDAAMLLRRNSSSGGPMNGAKRRAIFVPSLTAIFPQLAALLFDPNFAVASAARTTIMDLMRNDPALLSRPILEYLSGESKDIKLAITTLTTLIHIRRVLPPPFTHNIFNNLAGLLKFLARNSEVMDSLHDFALVVPVMASIATQVSDMSVKEIRRSKLEHFFIPTGSLWFSSSAPKGSMFPRHLKPSSNPFEQVPPSLVSITMIRVSQNMFFLSMLKRKYQDVQVIRKNMSRLVLPSLDDHGLAKNLEMYDYVPRKAGPDSRPSTKNVTIEVLSLMVCRSYILLVAQIFRSMPRHLSDRHELAVLVDGLNRALVTHGDDINIVSQVLIGFMVASTRFRRLFTTGGGYTLFMPALVKVYTENPSHPAIRSAIEYAINRFYALHEKSFLYQAINTIGQLAMLPDIDVEWFSRGVYEMFFSLKKGTSTSAVDVAGIRNVNKAEEREALIIHTADEKPQTFLASIRRVESQTGRHMSLQLPDEYESIYLSMDNFVRLFLTVIVHDLSIARAQYFLRLLRLLTPHLYNSSGPARNVLKDGIEALGSILTKVFSKPKGGESLPKPIPEEEDVAFLSSDIASDKNSKEKSRAPSDSKIIRLDYLQLVLSFGNAGGEVSIKLARFAFDITKSLLKDWGETNTDVLATFLGDFVKLIYRREDPAKPDAVVSFLRELSPILHSSLVMPVNLTRVFEGVLKLVEFPAYANDISFAQVVVGEIVTAGLAACDLAASENHLMALPYRPALISVLAEAVFLKNVDVIGELEKRPPTYHFLAGVILPLVLILKTESEVITDGLRTDEHRKMLAVAWLRILFYAIDACQKSRKDEAGTQGGMRGLGMSFTRPKSSDKRQGQDAFWRSHLPTFMTALQVIKVVIVRGSADISSLPRIGIWERISAFCKTMFAEGNADFALKHEISSAVTTPTGSPRASAQFDLSNSSSRLFVSTSSDLSRPSSPLSFTERKSYSRPRIIDYSLWSMLEFVCAYRSPLRMHLKVLMMEKVVALDDELQKQSGTTGVPHSPYPASPSSRRVSTSLFSKSRQRLSSLMVPSPDSSPRLAPQSSSLMPSPSLLDIPSRRPGYQMSPVSPHEYPGLPKIVHLGPTSPSAFPPMSSPMIGAGLPGVGIRASRISDDVGNTSSTSARSTKIKSLKLVKETYRRVRGVQTFMGYDLLLPLPAGRTPNDVGKYSDDDAALETWSRQRALAYIARETKDLIEEFEEGFGVEDESVFVDNPPEPRTSYSSS